MIFRAPNRKTSYQNHNTKKSTAISLSIVAILASALLIKSLIIKPNITSTLNILRKEGVCSLDSLNNKLETENRFFDSIQHLISSGKLKGADDVINQSLTKNPRNENLHILKEQVYDANEQYDSAMSEYNLVIQANPYPLALDKRAITFIKLGRYEDAIIDYKNAFEQNYDYSYKLARTFERAKQKDSALKYYKI